MSSNGYAVYKTAVHTKTDDPRDIEYRLLAQVTGAMIKARTDQKNFKGIVEAVMWNREVWTALRNDLTLETNQLPKELRAALISVSLWIEKETQLILKKTGDIEALIDVNRNIMAGLKPEHADDFQKEQLS